MANIVYYLKDSAHKAALQKFCNRMKITTTPVTVKDAGVSIASVLHLPQNAAMPYPSGVPTKTPANPFYQMPDFLLFFGFDSSDMDCFLAEYKKAGLPQVKIKAMATPYNLGWTIYELTEHVKEEAAEMASRMN